MSNYKIILPLVAAVSLAGTSYPAASEHEGYPHVPAYEIPRLDVSGYLGYKYIYSEIKDVPVRSFPEIGLLLNYQLTDHVSTYVQMSASEEAWDYGVEHALVYGYLTYANSFKGVSFDVNVGKIRHSMGIYGATVVNPSTRPGVVVPQAMYWDSLGSTLKSGYGVSTSVSYKDIEIGYSIGAPIFVDPIKESLMWSSTPFLEMDSRFGGHQIVNLNYTPSEEDYSFYSSFSRIEFNKTVSMEIATFGIDYSGTDSGLFGSAEMLLVKATGNTWSQVEDLRYGYSITAGYYLNETTEVHANYNVYESMLETGSPYVETNKHTREWRDVSVGLTKYLDPVEVKLDVHLVHGTRVLDPDAWADDKAEQWVYLGASVVYHF